MAQDYAYREFLFPDLDLEIARSPTSVSAFDGTTLRGCRYDVVRAGTGRKKRDKRSDNTLLCLPAPLASVHQHEAFILSLMQKTGSPHRCLSFDFRGRGHSDWADPDSYDIATEAADLVSFCDAHGLHHPDILVTGESVFAVLHALPARPTLLRRLLLHDAVPEFDPVGIVRMAQLWRSTPLPGSWDEATATLQRMFGAFYPSFGAGDWQVLARQIWGSGDQDLPISTYDPALTERFHDLDLDAPRPEGHDALRLLLADRVLLLAGARSPVVTADTVSKMRQRLPGFSHYSIPEQGHWPLLAGEDCVDMINRFLSGPPSASHPPQQD